MIFKRQKCKICDKKISKDDHPAEIRLSTAEGIHEIEVCQECAEFFDKSAEILAKRDRNYDDFDQEED